VAAMEETLWTHNEKLGVIDSLTPAHLDSFTQQLLSQGEVELFVHGNVLESEVRDVAKLVAERWKKMEGGRSSSCSLSGAVADDAVTSALDATVATFVPSSARRTRGYVLI
jgi:secreted Zn-dependent insulinase-like peptidase